MPKRSPFFDNEDQSFVLYHGDALAILSEMKDEQFDLIVADPPYFLSNGGMTCHSGKRALVDKGKWDVPGSVEENHQFNLLWLKECQRLLKPNGALWVSGTMHAIFSIGFAMQQLGYKLLNDVIWYKSNAPPNLSCRYFTHSTERLIWGSKNKKSKHVFNDALMRSFNEGKQMRNVWVGTDEDSAADLDLWKITAPSRQEKRHGKHPTQKPVELLRRILLASSHEGDLVFDPFQGSGTTGIVAHSLGRRYVGIDQEEKYLKMTVKRLNSGRIHPAVTRT